MEINDLIGSNLKAIRLKRNYTLDELSNVTGVSKSMLSAIERGKKSPTLNILIRINSSLKIPLTDLMKNSSKENGGVIRKEKMISTRTSEGFLLTNMLQYNDDHPFEIFYQQIQPHCRQDSNAQIGDYIKELCIPIKGQLTIEMLGSKYCINEGEIIWFTTNRDHSYINNTDEEVRVLMIIYYK